jgi:hypothetical protein
MILTVPTRVREGTLGGSDRNLPNNRLSLQQLRPNAVGTTGRNGFLLKPADKSADTG